MADVSEESLTALNIVGAGGEIFEKGVDETEGDEGTGDGAQEVEGTAERGVVDEGERLYNEGVGNASFGEVGEGVVYDLGFDGG